MERKPTMPTLRVTDPRFQYTSAARTDIRETFALWRVSQERPKAANVKPMKRRAG